MGRLTEIESVSYAKKSTAPGKAVVVKTKAGSISRNVELYHPPGISSAPTAKDRAIEIDVGGGVKVAIVTHNYKLEIEVSDGETIIYSTNAGGDTLKAFIKLDTDGNIDLNGSSKKLVTYTELNSALQGLITALNLALGTKQNGAGTAGSLSLDISAAQTAKVRTG